MRPTLLVAVREFRQLTSTRSFWLTLLLIPGMLTLLGLLPGYYRHVEGQGAFVVLDKRGCCLAEIDRHIELGYQTELIRRLHDYTVERHVSVPAEKAPWLSIEGRPVDDIDAQQFLDAGGVDATLALLRPLLPAAAPAFVVPPRPTVRVALPKDIQPDLSAEAFGERMHALLGTDFETSDGPVPLVLAAYIPPVITDRTNEVRFYTGSLSAQDLPGIIQGVVLHAARIEMMTGAGIDATLASRIEWFYPVQKFVAPTPGSNPQGLIVRSILPLGIAYLLLLTLIVSGTMMLQGVIEERSNKLIETILACVTAEQFMRGKLLGVGAAGLAIVGAWVFYAVIASNFLPRQVGELLAPALQTLHSPLIVVSMLFYFLTGYMLTSMLFLSIGAMSDSMQDAQGYLMPLVLLLSAPFIAIGGTVVGNPGGLLPQILSWIPIYTPFAMLARMGGGVSRGEVIGTAALLLLFIAAEFVMLGRVFRASLLRAGQAPRLRHLMRLMVKGVN